MLQTDRVNELKHQAKLKAIEESPLNNYFHEVNYPFHLRTRSRDIWDKLPIQKKKLLINFGDAEVHDDEKLPQIHLDFVDKAANSKNYKLSE